MREQAQPDAGRKRLAAAERRRGTTVVEILVVMTITAMAVSIFSGMVVNTMRQRTINRENAIAGEAARMVVETMRNASFSEVFALYNEDPADDPGGAGTAAGKFFAVDGLRPAEGVAADRVGEILFPEVIPDEGAGSQLREDMELDQLAMPRDLNGDSLIDDLDHADDYILLPVLITVSWDGPVGERTFELYVMLADFKT